MISSIIEHLFQTFLTLSIQARSKDQDEEQEDLHLYSWQIKGIFLFLLKLKTQKVINWTAMIRKKKVIGRKNKQFSDNGNEEKFTLSLEFELNQEYKQVFEKCYSSNRSVCMSGGVGSAINIDFLAEFSCIHHSEFGNLNWDHQLTVAFHCIVLQLKLENLWTYATQSMIPRIIFMMDEVNKVDLNSFFISIINEILNQQPTIGDLIIQGHKKLLKQFIFWNPILFDQLGRVKEEISNPLFGLQKDIMVAEIYQNFDLGPLVIDDFLQIMEGILARLSAYSAPIFNEMKIEKQGFPHLSQRWKLNEASFSNINEQLNSFYNTKLKDYSVQNIINNLIVSYFAYR
ncbi:UNKNOWN [Stylonychia lemnae]|uniref:Uncharacterized protein n=1 Tax=Stylonychia lemnae TaxID=5949 RepID=A0A078A764_STYLE|nr:UNKNOWN [Stylonychia lemnae]|eukprot:CDW76636.1 UNKNOWN [Stylonychia lemnae]